MKRSSQSLHESDSNTESKRNSDRRSGRNSDNERKSGGGHAARRATRASRLRVDRSSCAASRVQGDSTRHNGYEHDHGNEQNPNQGRSPRSAAYADESFGVPRSNPAPLFGCAPRLSVQELSSHLRSLRSGFHRVVFRVSALLKGLMDHRLNRAGLFNVPVDVVKLNLPTYLSIVKEPMDLGTIKGRLEDGVYQSVDAFAADVRLVFNNALMFNPAGHPVHEAARTLLRTFEADLERMREELREARNREAAHRCSHCSGNACPLCLSKCLEYQVPVLRCSAPCKAKIPRGATFHRLGGERGQYWCERCFQALPETFVGLTGKQVAKKDLEEHVHGEVLLEPLIECQRCRRWIHQVCGLYNAPAVDAFASELGAAFRAADFVCPLCVLQDLAGGQQELGHCGANCKEEKQPPSQNDAHVVGTAPPTSRNMAAAALAAVYAVNPSLGYGVEEAVVACPSRVSPRNHQGRSVVGRVGPPRQSASHPSRVYIEGEACNRHGQRPETAESTSASLIGGCAAREMSAIGAENQPPTALSWLTARTTPAATAAPTDKELVRLPLCDVEVGIPHCLMSTYIEHRVRRAVVLSDGTDPASTRTGTLDLASRKALAASLNVRVVSNVDCSTWPGPRFTRWSQAQDVSLGQIPPRPLQPRQHRSKALVVTQRIDGVPVIVFVLYSQEYGACDLGKVSGSGNNSSPNQRTVYISYLDSVTYLRPRTKRTFVYHEVITAYFEWVKARGFRYVYIWACPPQRGDAYIMHCHPKWQRTPGAERLRRWYNMLIDTCRERGVVVGETNVHQRWFPHVRTLMSLRAVSASVPPSASPSSAPVPVPAPNPMVSLAGGSTGRAGAQGASPTSLPSMVATTMTATTSSSSAAAAAAVVAASPPTTTTAAQMTVKDMHNVTHDDVETAGSESRTATTTTTATATFPTPLPPPKLHVDDLPIFLGDFLPTEIENILSRLSASEGPKGDVGMPFEEEAAVHWWWDAVWHRGRVVQKDVPGSGEEPHTFIKIVPTPLPCLVLESTISEEQLQEEWINSPWPADVKGNVRRAVARDQWLMHNLASAVLPLRDNLMVLQLLGHDEFPQPKRRTHAPHAAHAPGKDTTSLLARAVVTESSIGHESRIGSQSGTGKGRGRGRSRGMGRRRGTAGGAGKVRSSGVDGGGAIRNARGRGRGRGRGIRGGRGRRTPDSGPKRKRQGTVDAVGEDLNVQSGSTLTTVVDAGENKRTSVDVHLSKNDTAVCVQVKADVVPPPPPPSPPPPQQQQQQHVEEEKEGDALLVRDFDDVSDLVHKVTGVRLEADTSDPDPVLPLGIFDTRLAFLDLCQMNNLQFDQLRRAKHSSTVLLGMHVQCLRRAAARNVRSGVQR